jgi:hypothetical protein
MKQTLLKIEIPKGKELRGADFREMLAKEGNLPEAFFHYQNGRPMVSKGGDKLEIDSLPGISVVSGRGWVGVLAQPGKEDLIDAVVAKAIRLVNQRIGSVCKAEIQNPVFGCSAQEKPSTYWVRELVMKRRHPAAREASIETLVERRIKAGLERYSIAYGHDLPSWDVMDFRITKCERPRGLAIRTTSGVTNEYATLVDVEFKAFVDLKGIWMVGNLTSRGYGRIGYFKENSLSELKVIK